MSETKKKNKRGRRRKQGQPQAKVKVLYTKEQIPQKSRRKLGKMSKGDPLLTRITLPRETRPIRFPNQGDMAKTALFDLYTDGMFTHAPLAADNFTASYFILTPSPVTPMWCTRAPTVTALSSWTLSLNESVNIVHSNGTFHRDQFKVAIGVISVDSPPPALLPDEDEFPMFYIPASASLTITVANMGAVTGNVNVTMAVYQNYKDNTKWTIDTLAVNNGSGSGTFTFATAGFIRMVDMSTSSGIANVAAATTLTFQVNVLTTRRYILPMASVIEQSTLAEIRQMCRVNSNALLISNSSAMLQRGGEFRAARVCTLNDPLDTNVWVPAHITNMITNSHKSMRYTGDGKMGIYTFTIPFKNSQRFTSYQPTNYTWKTMLCMTDFDFVNVIEYSASTTGSSTQQDFVWQYDEHMEAVTTSQIFPIAHPTVTMQRYQDALGKAVDYVPFTENPSHIWKLGMAIGRALVRNNSKRLKYYVDNGATVLRKLIDSA